MVLLQRKYQFLLSVDYLKSFYYLRPVSTTSVEKSILCLFYCFFFALASILTARFNRRSIKETKNALFHARSGNGPLRKFLLQRIFLSSDYEFLLRESITNSHQKTLLNTMTTNQRVSTSNITSINTNKLSYDPN